MANWAWMRTLETPQVIIEDVSSAKEGQVMERLSSYVFACSFMKADGNRYYYFTSVAVSKDGKGVLGVAERADEREKRGALETAYPEESGSLTVVSSAHGAKVLQNIETMVRKLK